MRVQTIKATDAARSFSDIINKVRYQGYSFNIQRGREIVAKITPPGPSTAFKVTDLNDFFSQLPHLDKKDKLDFDKDVKKIRSETKHVEDSFVEAILAKIHTELYSYLSKKGKLIGARDLIIGATALAHGCALLTDNIAEFKKVPGLEVLSDNSK